MRPVIVFLRDLMSLAALLGGIVGLFAALGL